jgi:hypothetical protein
MTAVEAEAELGDKYFYRQKTYRYEKSKRLKAFKFRDQQCFMRTMLLSVYVDELEQKIKSQFPELKGYKAYFDLETHRMVIDGLFGRYVAVNSFKETEEDLLAKLRTVVEWMAVDGSPDEKDETPASVPTASVDVDKPVTPPEGSEEKGELSTIDGMPDEIQFVKIDTRVIEGVEVKSFILISLPSIAQFIGVRSDNFSRWIQQSTFSAYIVSTHGRQIHGTQNRGSWKKGYVQGLVPMLPLELIPELLVAFRNSGATPQYPARAEQLYNLARSTLEAVGLAVSGNKEFAATELAKIGQGLGISAADQVIGIFKQYESRPFQVETNLKFRGKVKRENKDFKIVTGSITLGVTGRPASYWLALGTIKKLPSKNRTSGREVMRTLSPADSVGVTFSESHYLKDSSNMGEVIKTGEQGKEFYQRLKDVGLLDD